MLISSTVIAQSKVAFSRKYFSLNTGATYINDALLSNFSAIACLFNKVAGVCQIPEHSLGVNLDFAASFPFGTRWAFRPMIGYQLVAWHSSVFNVNDISNSYRHSVNANLLFDVYFNSAGPWYPYFSFGPGLRHTFKPMAVVGGGAHYHISEDLSLQLELKAASLVLFTNVEPRIGVAFLF